MKKLLISLLCCVYAQNAFSCATIGFLVTEVVSSFTDVHVTYVDSEDFISSVYKGWVKVGKVGWSVEIVEGKKVLFINVFAIDKMYQRQGLGRVALNVLEKKINPDEIVARSVLQNARPFWEKCGFVLASDKASDQLNPDYVKQIAHSS